MHSAHRDLESKYKRVLSDLANSNKQNTALSAKLIERTNEVSILKTFKAENESTMAQDKEEIDSLKREMQIKLKQLKEVELRCQRAIDEADLGRVKIQDLLKDNTEMKLKVDVQ